MKKMNRRERFLTAVAGQKTDRVPVCVWMHFVTPFLPGQESAKLHSRFIRHYGWDVAKAVSDYRFPLPDGLETIATVDDMARITVPEMSHPTYAEQISLLNGLRAELGKNWPIIDTTFDPIQQILRRSGFSTLKVMLDNPGRAKPMIEAATETVIRYTRELKKNGVDGVFYSTRAAATQACSQGYSEEAFNELLRPYDIAILSEMEGMVRILHACKDHLDLSRVQDYPHEVLSWTDRDPTCPDLEEVHRHSSKCLMGGIDQCRVIEQSTSEIRRDAGEAIARVDGQGLILSPGCTIGSNAPGHVFSALAEFTRENPALR